MPITWAVMIWQKKSMNLNNTTTKNMEQNNMTAVEWLVKRFLLSGNNLLMSDVEQAKQMEKEQLINAHKEGNKHNGWALQHEHEKYYNELYGKKTEG